MKKAILLVIINVALTILGATQTIEITFSASEEVSTIDSVMAINRIANDTVTLPGDEILFLGNVNSARNLDIGKERLKLYPNPLDGTGTLTFYQAQSGTLRISVRNVLCQDVVAYSRPVVQGTHTFKISLYQSGVYFITVADDINSRSIKTICTGDSRANDGIQKLDGTSQPKDSHNNLKAGADGIYRLGYTIGDVLGFYAYSGEITSIISAVPFESQNYEFEFVECRDDDGRDYEYTRIGNQLWMAENLAYLPVVIGPEEGSITEKLYYVYDYYGTDVTEAKGTIHFDSFGVLYNYEAAMSACPEGWLLPTNDDWKELEKYLGKVYEPLNNKYWFSTLGHHLKSASGWFHWRYTDCNGTNNTGFNAFAAKSRSSRGYFEIGDFNTNLDAHFWSSSSVNDERVISRAIHEFGELRSPSPLKSNGLHVRCVRSVSKKIPEVTTKQVSLISGTTAHSGGSILNDNGSEIVQMGVCWRIHERPTIWDFITIDGNNNGSFESLMHDLMPRSIYSVRAYATNERGTGYGNIYTFETVDGSFIDERDNKHYGFVNIGEQTWMEENLAYSPETGNSWFFENDSMNLKTYGRLYDWITATSDHGNGTDICPVGWHLPSDEEWKALELNLRMDTVEADLVGYRISGDVGEQLKSFTGWNNDGNGNNYTGFDALPSGLSYNDGEYDAIGDNAIYWTSTPYDSTKSWNRSLLFNFDGIGRMINDNSFGFAVRCIKNE